MPTPSSSSSPSARASVPLPATLTELQELLNQLRPAIFEVGRFIRRERQQFDQARVEFKGFNDLVSYVDRTAEERLIAYCQELLPGSGFICEETGSEGAQRDAVWIIDPLDGTTNFVYGIPVYSISLALQLNGELALGVVYELNNDEFFYGLHGGGAWLNGQQIRVNADRSLKQSLVATGFPYQKFGQVDDYLHLLREFMQRTRGIRRLGSAAVDLAYTAAGRFDGFFESNLKPWDVAAGALLVQEAGGKVTEYNGGADFLHGRTIAAANPTLYPEMVEIVLHYANRSSSSKH